MQNISERIKSLRLKAGYSSYETFAQDKNLDRKGYWRLENGYNFAMKSLFRILDIHNLTIQEFFCEVSQDQKK